jgi:hypothetical protein
MTATRGSDRHLIEIQSLNGFAGAKDTDTATCSCKRVVGPARFGPYAYAEAWEDGERHMVNPCAGDDTDERDCDGFPL